MEGSQGQGQGQGQDEAKFTLEDDQCEANKTVFCVIKEEEEDKGKCTKGNHMKKKRDVEQSKIKIDEFLDPEKRAENRARMEKAKKEFREGFRWMDEEKSYENLMEILWRSQMPCFKIKGITDKESNDDLEMVKRCVWKGKEIKCNGYGIGKDSLYSLENPRDRSRILTPSIVIFQHLPHLPL